jgi:hypothetical protein
VTVQTPAETFTIRAKYFLDATDTGDLLPLTHTPYVTGAEAQSTTGEPQAALTAIPHEVQSFTYCFAVEYCAGEDHTIAKPADYEQLRHHYTLAPLTRDGTPLVYKMFVPNGELLPFWSYRRIYDGQLLGGNDLALINWVSNDYYGGNILDSANAAHDLSAAKQLSLGFLYWLQTECPRDEGGVGYPELKLRPDIMGTDDGLSQAPYIRESRRIVPLRRIVEQDITAEFQSGARAQHWRDSVGIGWYALDLHPCVGNPHASRYAATRPFQISLGAFIAPASVNLVPACKNIGTTHLTNGAYRLHPIEWAIGNAAALLAAYCIEQDLTPAQIAADDWWLWRLQYRLVQSGCPLFWALDVPLQHPHFLATQLLLVHGIIVPNSPRWHRLDIGLDQRLGDSIHLPTLRQLAETLNQHLPTARIPLSSITADRTWAAICELFAPCLALALA